MANTCALRALGSAGNPKSRQSPCRDRAVISASVVNEFADVPAYGDVVNGLPQVLRCCNPGNGELLDERSGCVCQDQKIVMPLVAAAQVEQFMDAAGSTAT